MRNTIFLLVAIIIASCGSSKRTSPVPQSPEIVTQTVVTLPQKGSGNTPDVQESDIIETPQTPKEDCVELPEVIEVVPAPETPEIIDDSNQYVDEDIIITNIPADHFDHSTFETLLQRYVTEDGVVNYEGIKSEWNLLRKYIGKLGEKSPSHYSWSDNKPEKLAYWMNAYNAMTIDLILRHQPLESIKDIKDPWKQRFWKLGEKYYNLDEIEHQILRKMDDPRIHFGINCASFSCPPLLNEAFTAEKVNSQLENLATKFINDPKRNTITTDRVEISKIFDWFAKDFETSGSIIDYLNKYSKTKISADARVRFMDYDWALND